MVSPNSLYSLAAIFLKILLIIFPDLVFGKLGANCIISGVANGPICFLTQSLRSLSKSPFDCSPEFYARGADKVQKASEQYKLFYQSEDFDPQQFFINQTL